MKNENRNKSYSPEDLADRWSVTLSYIYKLVERKKLRPVLKLSPKALRIPLSTIEDYEANATIGDTK